MSIPGFNVESNTLQYSLLQQNQNPAKFNPTPSSASVSNSGPIPSAMNSSNNNHNNNNSEYYNQNYYYSSNTNNNNASTATSSPTTTSSPTINNTSSKKFSKQIQIPLNNPPMYSYNPYYPPQAAQPQENYTSSNNYPYSNQNPSVTTPTARTFSNSSTSNVPNSAPLLNSYYTHSNLSPENNSIQKRYSVSYPMGNSHLPINYNNTGSNNSSNNNSNNSSYPSPTDIESTSTPTTYSHPQHQQQFGYSFSAPPKPMNLTPTPYNFGNNNNNYYYNHPQYSQPLSNHGNMLVKQEDFLNDLSPTVMGFQNHHHPKLEDTVDEQPIPLNLSSTHQPLDFGDKDVFEVFKDRLDNLRHVKLLRTNTLPKEEISRNITVIDNQNKKVYFNFEYPTVSITFRDPINNVSYNWSDHEKNITKRRLTLFYWDFSLVKSNTVINNGINRTLSDPSAKSPEFLNENLEYIKSVLHLKYEIITEEEYQILFEDKNNNNPQITNYRIQHLVNIIKDLNNNTMKNNFCIISCLYWNFTNNFYLTSVDLLFLLDKLSGRTTNITNNISTSDVVLIGSSKIHDKKNKFASKQQVKKLKQAAKLLKAIDGKEVNRIRRNLLNFKSITLGKAEADFHNEEEFNQQHFGASNYGTEEEMEFFHVIMGFKNPKPRKIEKKLKVYEWCILEKALDKIMKKYCVDLKTVNPLQDNLRESGFY